MKCFISGKECQYSSEEDQRRVFVISPYGYPYDDIYLGEDGIEGILKKFGPKDIDENSLIEGNFMPERANQAFQIGFVMCQRICRRIQRSQFIVADISQPNPNVFYELGLSYGLKKKIILIGQKTFNEASTFGMAKSSDSYIHYRSIEDFKKKDMFVSAFKNPIINSMEIPELPDSTILNIINDADTIMGLHEKVLLDSINELKEEALKAKKVGNVDIGLKNEWKIISKSISKNSRIDEILNQLEICKVCVVDSSFHGRRSEDSNPYLFFCLGLGHGLQKEIVPLTSMSEANDILPFDVRGLWHIFFRDLEQLKSQFKGIIPEIDKNWTEEQNNYLHKGLWDPILKNRELHIMTCARDIEEEHRGARTNIDKWDYETVSKLTHFLALRYPKAEVKISNPISKLLDDERIKIGNEKVLEDIASRLMDKDCIIVGSPDVSDLAEIVLAKLHKIAPYQNKRQKFKGYVIIKKLQPDKTSSFYWERDEKKNEEDCICLYNEKADAYTSFKNPEEKGEGTVYGFLTIANNPFVSPEKKRKIMIFSGFSGIATYAIAELLTNDEFLKDLKEESSNYQRLKEDVEILVGVKYKIDTLQKGDKRIFKKVFFQEIIDICKAEEDGKS